jgi:hypothetical protein
VPPRARRWPHWEWRWDTISTWAMPGFTTATERKIAPAPAPHPQPKPPPAPPRKSGQCGWYGWWSDAGCRTWASGSCQQAPWVAPPGHASSSTLHQRYPNGSYTLVGTNLYCANPTIYMCGPNCTTTDADCRAVCDREQPHEGHRSDGVAPPPVGSAGQMTRAEALYYSNFSIFSTQTWDVACEGGGVAVCANFNDCECLNATTGEHQVIHYAPGDPLRRAGSVQPARERWNVVARCSRQSAERHTGTGGRPTHASSRLWYGKSAGEGALSDDLLLRRCD